MANKFYIVPNVRSKSASIKESSGIEFLCPTNTVMTGRWHKGDENGQTQYEYATLKAVDEQGNTVQAKIEVTDIQWSASLKESSGTGFIASGNRVIVGRYHKGDENGYTKYATAIVKANGEIATVIDTQDSQTIKESSGTWFVTDAQRVIIGRVHKGDENGRTYYVTAKLLIDSNLKEPAPEGTRIVIDRRFNSSSFKESDSVFECPANTVMTGRSHSGDENGTTIYQYASLKAINAKGETIMGIITIEDVIETTVQSESSGKGFIAPANRVIIGRKHIGDENASSMYKTGIVKFNGYPTFISQYGISQLMKENSSAFNVKDDQVITAQCHHGDENGFTYYGFGSIFCQKQVENVFPFDVIVSLHSKEEYFPMSATDFAILSRFRMHRSGESDKGYNKETGTFDTSNSQALKYYGAPLSKINSYYSEKPNYRLYNLRPRDFMALPGEGYFLQPFMHLYGVPEPNGIVPSYVHKNVYTDVDGSQITLYDFWLFFGYNQVLIMAHEGDWEHLMVEVKGGKIIGAWLSSHTSLEYHPSTIYRAASHLNIKVVNGRQQLTVYCSKGTHALYATANEASYPDSTDSGYEWKITDTAQTLSEQPWCLFAGAWGEVGERRESTGPLGPWYKRFDFWWEAKTSLSTFVGVNDVIIVPDQYFLSSQQKESSEGLSFEAPDNMVIAGRRHGGDENGMSVCLYATLKAINGRGANVPGTVTIDNARWTEWIKESTSIFEAPSGYVIVGREHTGDENGNTRYKIARVSFNGKAVTTVSANSKFEYQYYKEYAGVFFKTEPYLAYIGRKHTGDENGVTENYQGILKV